MNVVSANESFVVKQLQAILPAHCIITDPRAKKPFETDGLTAVKQMPWIVVLPENVEQVRAVQRVCRENRLPLVPRGAGTGLSGGARPASDGVLLGLSKLSRIIEIDPDNRIARVEPGVRNLAISEAAARYAGMRGDRDRGAAAKRRLDAVTALATSSLLAVSADRLPGLPRWFTFVVLFLFSAMGGYVLLRALR